MTTPGSRPDPLRSAWAERAAAPASGSCPPPERLWDAAHGSSPPAEARTLVQHTIECAACAEAWRLARELGSLAERPDLPGAVGRRWWGGWRGIAAALAVLGLALAVVLGRGPARPLSPGYREGQTAGVRSLVPEPWPLPRAACVLRWSSAGPGARYNLQVASEDLVLLHTAKGLDSPHHQVPEADLARLPRGARIVWQVAVVRDGETAAAGPAFVSRIE